MNKILFTLLFAGVAFNGIQEASAGKPSPKDTEDQFGIIFKKPLPPKKDKPKRPNRIPGAPLKKDLAVFQIIEEGKNRLNHTVDPQGNTWWNAEKPIRKNCMAYRLGDASTWNKLPASSTPAASKKDFTLSGTVSFQICNGKVSRGNTPLRVQNGRALHLLEVAKTVSPQPK